jgi:hypothetical protein
MIIFYSGEENRSLPEYVIPNSTAPNATVMFTYFIHCQNENPSSRFKRLAESRGEEVTDVPIQKGKSSKDVKEKIKKAKEVEEPEEEEGLLESF